MSAATGGFRLGVVLALSLPAFALAMEPDPHAGHDMHAGHDEHAGHAMPAAPDSSAPREPVPPLTDADRAAAQPPSGGHGAHAAHDNAMFSFLRIDRLEAAPGARGEGVAWEAQGWVGTDLDRLWLRTQGRGGADADGAEIELLYGHSVARWWDVVGGLRRDQGNGPTRHYAGFGVLGLAPFSFEVEATAYVGDGGRTAARLSVEYPLLLTNRLIAEPMLEIDAYGRDDAARGIGSGLATVEAGLRLRYEFRRRFAPYVGVSVEHSAGRTADLAVARGQDRNDTRVVAGLRTWF